MKQFFKRVFLIFCKEVLILKIKKRTLLSFLLKNIFFFEKHKLVSTIEVLYKIIFGEKNEFRFHLWFLEFRVQGSFLCQDMLVCVNIFIRGWVGFLFWFFEIFEFLFSLMLVRLLLICLHVCCCWTFIERKVAVGIPISNIHLELEHPSRRIFIII